MTEPNGAVPTQVPATPVAGAPRRVAAFNPKKAFQATNSMERLKEYLKEVPVLHKRLADVVAGLETNLAAAKASLAQFDETTSRVRTLVDRMEKEERAKHAGPDTADGPGSGRSPGDPTPGAATGA